jgi:hypothetical protein
VLACSASLWLARQGTATRGFRAADRGIAGHRLKLSGGNASRAGGQGLDNKMQFATFQTALFSISVAFALVFFIVIILRLFRLKK